jgi:DNA invertase Pin-like site-specific DNA recombinase
VQLLLTSSLRGRKLRSVSKLVAYLRVSTDRQAEEGFGLGVQEKTIRGWARANGHRVALWCRDEGVSGSNGVEDREGLPEALTALRDGRGDGLVVARLDRLARNLSVQEAVLAKVWDLRCDVYAVDLGLVARDDPDDPMRTALRQMVGVFAQLERSMISKRLRDGRRHKAEQGGYAYGAPGLGYRAEGGELVADDAEQAVVNRIRELHAAGQSTRQIAATLEAEGHRTKRGGSWQSMTVARVIARLG